MAFWGSLRVLAKLPVPSHITPAVANAQTTFVGKVVSNAMMKTVKVAVPRQKLYKKLGKVIWMHKKFAAHDELEACALGDTVQIRSCRPLSKTKHWFVEEILKRAPQFADASSTASTATPDKPQKTTSSSKS
eukprot:c3352_g1_i1.p1 GENE.c3352_g1_i1~~c3352_g1_i1.p1  ORF type:complete len:132 (-),score=25.54 c3352_g1_i1:268-663(-)